MVRGRGDIKGGMREGRIQRREGIDQGSGGKDGRQDRNGSM